jgi:hypothetical protein
MARHYGLHKWDQPAGDQSPAPELKPNRESFAIHRESDGADFVVSLHTLASYKIGYAIDSVKRNGGLRLFFGVRLDSRVQGVRKDVSQSVPLGRLDAVAIQMGHIRSAILISFAVNR